MTEQRTLTYEQLLAEDLSMAEPALVSGLDVLPELWTPEDVVNTVGSQSVPIAHISNGDYVRAAIRTRTVADYYDEISGAMPTDPFPYLAELSYDEHFPELARQLIDPPPLPDERFMHRVMYFGRGIHSQIHFHTGGSAILFGIHGTKVVRLFAPDQTPNLYKVKGRNFSSVLVSSVGENSYAYDKERFPDFADAEYVEYEVRAGDVLFIPVYWWHSIQNLRDISLTAVYFWRQDWKGTWRDIVPKQLPPPGMRVDYWRNLANSRLLGPIRTRR